MGALSGLVCFVMMLMFSEYSLTGSIFMALVVAGISSPLMIFMFCRELPPIGTAAQPASVRQDEPARPVPGATTTPKPVAVPEPKQAAAAKPASAPAAAAPAAASDDGDKPEGLTAARDGKGDNLKEIKGVGPKLENLLNSMGYYHFDQIAGWSAKEVAWVDENLQGFKGRVSRDGWVDQAKILAAGGETEFSKRVDDGDVY